MTVECPRCCEAFKTPSELKRHISKKTICEVVVKYRKPKVSESETTICEYCNKSIELKRISTHECKQKKEVMKKLEKQMRNINVRKQCAVLSRTHISQTLKKRLIEEQKNSCAICRKSIQTVSEIDHIRPLSFGGTNDESNLQVLCPNCHATKTRLERKKRQNK